MNNMCRFLKGYTYYLGDSPPPHPPPIIQYPISPGTLKDIYCTYTSFVVVFILYVTGSPPVVKKSVKL